MPGRRVIYLPAQIMAALAVHLDRYCAPDPSGLVTGPSSDDPAESDLL